MKIPFEDHFDVLGKVIGALLKFGIFVGSACVVAYSLRIGRFPQGLTLGDSLLLLMAAVCFGIVVTFFIFSLIGLGIALSPIVRSILWIVSKISPSFGTKIKNSPFELAPLSWFAALGAFFALVMITVLSERDPSFAWDLPVLSIGLYFIYSVYVSASSQLIDLAKIVNSPIATPLQSDYGTLQRMLKLRIARWGAPLLILVVSLFLSGAMGEVLDASMRGAKVRLEAPTVYIKEPYSSLMPKALIIPTLEAPGGFRVYKKVSVLFHGFGNVTVIAFEDGDRRRTLDIPNEFIIIERR